MARLAAALAVTALLVAAPSAHAQAPSNDTVAGAAALPLNQPVSGDLGDAANDYRLSGSLCFGGIGQTLAAAEGNDVVYRFVAPRAGDYSFRVTETASTNSVLYVAAALPTGPGPSTVTACLAAANRNAPQEAEEVSGLPLAAGQQVFVVADSQAGTSDPTAFKLVAERPFTETESNASTATADLRTCGAVGRSGTASDVDFWSVGPQNAGSRLFALVDGAAGSGADWDLRATTAVDTLEYDDSDADTPHGLTAPMIAGTRVGNVASFLRVDSPGGENEPYRLYSVVRGLPIGIDAEPNGTPAQAHATQSLYGSATIGSASDVDVYSFSAPARGLMFIGLDADPLRDNTPFNARLALLDAAGATLAEVDTPNGASVTTSGAGTLTSTTPSSPGEALALRLPAAGVYYVRVATSAGVGSGDYLLSAAYQCRPTAIPAPIDVTPPALPGGTQGAPYSQALSASGGVGSHSFAVSSGSLPPGLNLAAGGTLDGTPTQSGAFSFTVTATDEDDAVGERPYALEVTAPPASGPGPGSEPGPGAPGPGPGTGTPADTAAPQARITKKPTKKLRARRVSFSFSSNERGSKFQCKIDKKRFGTCRSPKRYSLKPGKHTFQVRATDAAGNVDRSPAKYAFTLLRPKR